MPDQNEIAFMQYHQLLVDVKKFLSQFSFYKDGEMVELPLRTRVGNALKENQPLYNTNMAAEKIRAANL